MQKARPKRGSAGPQEWDQLCSEPCLAAGWRELQLSLSALRAGGAHAGFARFSDGLEQAFFDGDADRNAVRDGFLGNQNPILALVRGERFRDRIEIRIGMNR